MESAPVTRIEVCRFVVPGPPVAKARPRVSLRGGVARTYTPRRTTRYEAEVAVAAIDAMDGRQPLDEPLAVEITARFPVPESWSRSRRERALSGETHYVSRPDIDNVAKAILDGANGIVWADDAWIVQLTTLKAYARAPEVEVRVWRITDTRH